MSEEPKDQIISSATTSAKPIKVKISAMVDNALKSLNERSGSSLIAIKKFLSGTYSINVEKSSGAIKKYIKESVESGKFIQTKGKTLSGSFKLSKDALKASEPNVRKKKPKEGTVGNEKKTKKAKEPKATKDAASKEKAVSASKKEVQPKKTTAQKKVPGPKLTAAAPKKKTTEGKIKLAKKQESEAGPIKKTATGKKAKSPAKKKDKENIPPTETKKKSQTKKKEEPSLSLSPVVDHDDHEDSEELLTASPKINVKETLSFIDSANDQEPDEESVHSDEDEDGDAEPKETVKDQLNESDGSVSAEESPEKPKTKPKGKVGSKPVKKRKSIATLANQAKPKIAKK